MRDVAVYRTTTTVFRLVKLHSHSFILHFTEPPSLSGLHRGGIRRIPMDRKQAEHWNEVNGFAIDLDAMEEA